MNKKANVVPASPEPVQKSAALSKGPKTPKIRANQAVPRKLKKLKFDPLTQLINHVYPELPPEEKAKVLFKLLEYTHPKLKAEDAGKQKRKNPLIQVNTQVNVPEKTKEPEPVEVKQIEAPKKVSLQELLDLAQINHGRTQTE